MGIVSKQIARKIHYCTKDRIDGKGWFVYHGLTFKPYPYRDRCVLSGEELKDFEYCQMWLEHCGKPFSLMIKGFYYRNQLDGYDILDNVLVLEDLSKRSRLVYDAVIDYRTEFEEVYRQRFLRFSVYQNFNFNLDDVAKRYSLMKSNVSGSDTFSFIFSDEFSTDAFRYKLFKDYAIFEKIYDFLKINS